MSSRDLEAAHPYNSNPVRVNFPNWIIRRTYCMALPGIAQLESWQSLGNCAHKPFLSTSRPDAEDHHTSLILFTNFFPGSGIHSIRFYSELGLHKAFPSPLYTQLDLNHHQSFGSGDRYAAFPSVVPYPPPSAMFCRPIASHTQPSRKPSNL